MRKLLRNILSALLVATTLSVISTVSAPMALAAQSSECVIGSSSTCPATSPQEIYNLYGTTTNGTYWIKVNGTATQVYVLMDRTNSDNGSWILMMKGAPSSTTFTYSSNYWTDNTTTLNTASLTNDVDTDAKFSVFNNLSVKKMLAVFKPGGSSGTYPYDAGTYGIPNGGDLASNPFGGHVWLETLASASTAQTRVTNNNILYNTAATIPVTKYKKSAATGADRVFSYQNPMGHYGFDITTCSAGGSKLRWGFQWNENGVTEYGSCDMWGGIGGELTSAHDRVIWKDAGCEAACAAPGTAMGHKNLSFQIWGKTAEPSLGAPTSVSANTATPMQVSLSWGAPASTTPSDYIVQYKLAAASNYSNSLVVSGQTTAQITGLTGGASYNFRVLARTASDSTSTANLASSTITTTTTSNPTTTILTTDPSAVYGATNTLTATVSSNTATGTMNFKNGANSITGCSAAPVTAGIATCTTWKPSVGTYALTAAYSGSELAGASTSESVSFQITQAQLSVIPDAKSVIYGASSPSYTFTYQGFVNGDSASTSSFTTGLTAPVCTNASYSTSTSVSASPLTISCSGGSSTNYTFDSTGTSQLTISKAKPTFNSWANLSKNYGDPLFGLTAPIPSTPGSFTYNSSQTSILSISAETATVVGIGSSIITATFTPTDATNYTSGETVTMTTTVGRALITVTPDSNQSRVYGASDPTITYTVTSGALVGGEQLSGALTHVGAGQNTATGSYAITSGTLTSANNPNYTITLASVNFAITKATQSAVSLSSLSASYSSSNKNITLTGSGGSGPNTYSYALDPGNTTVGCSVAGSTLTYTTAGTCIVAVTNAESTNYFAQTNAVSFSVGLASQTISFASLSAKNYSSETFTVSATASSSLIVVFTSGSPSVCTTSGSDGSTITLLGVGTCVIYANQPGDANTAAASQVSQNFTVNPRAITATADAKTKVLGAAEPTYTYAITSGSLVLGDSLTGALTRVAGTDAGNYQIQAGTLTDANNPKYAITFISADLTITRATPTLSLSYPNSNVAILRPGAVDTPTVTTSSSAGTLTFATSSSICTVETSTGVIALLGAGSCVIAMTTAQTTNYIQYTETTTVTIALLSTSLEGIDSNDLISMGQPFYAHASIDQSYSFSSGSNGASVSIPAGALDATVPISIHLLTDSADQRAMIGGTGTSVLSVVVSWVASDGSVPNTNAGKAIAVTLTNPAIKSGAKIYSIIGNQSRLLGTASSDGSVTTQITEDPVLLVINPVVTTPVIASVPAPSPSTSSAGTYVIVAAVDNSLAIAQEAAERKAVEEKKAAEVAEAAALKAAQELVDAQARADAEIRAAKEKAAVELRIAEELRLAQLKAEEEMKAAAEKKAAEDAAVAVKTLKPAVTLYSVSTSLKLNAYSTAYLQKYVKTLKNGTSVTCIGYSYSKNTTVSKANALAKRQATAVCSLMLKTNKTLKTSIVVYPSSKAPKAAAGAKWVGVSYRIDGFKAP